MATTNTTCEHHHHDAPKQSKYEEALNKYNLDIDDAAVKEAVRTLIAEKVHENDTPEVKRFLMGSIELTTLKTTDSDTSVLAFTERVNEFDNQYPDLRQFPVITGTARGQGCRDRTGNKGRRHRDRHRDACGQVPQRRL